MLVLFGDPEDRCSCVADHISYVLNKVYKRTVATNLVVLGGLLGYTQKKSMTLTFVVAVSVRSTSNILTYWLGHAISVYYC